MNDQYHEPICHPMSMQMPVGTISELVWNEDWYTTWKSRRENPNKLINDERGANIIDDVALDDGSIIRDFDWACDWKEAPQVGTLCTVRVKEEGRISRIHHSHNSILRRSRWRKKYRKRAIFGR